MATPAWNSMTTPGMELSGEMAGRAPIPSMLRTPSLRSARSNLTSIEAQEEKDAARLASTIDRRRVQAARRVERLQERDSPRGFGQTDREYAAQLNSQLEERASHIMQRRESEAQLHRQVQAHNASMNMSEDTRQARRRQLAESARDENLQLARERKEYLASQKARAIEADLADAGKFFDQFGRSAR